MNETQDKWRKAVVDTDSFYDTLKGYSYSDEQVDNWLSRWFFRFIDVSGSERVLDLCCGDGCWSFGMLRRFPTMEITGIDVSKGAVNVANSRAICAGLGEKAIFHVHDCEKELPVPRDHFDLIFARGLFVFNQHNMNRTGTLNLLTHWHTKLKYGGKFIAMYGSKPERFGSYTAPEATKGLPTNLCPRTTAALEFAGGKFNHSPASFIQPFLSLDYVIARIICYKFKNNRHTLVTERIN